MVLALRLLPLAVLALALAQPAAAQAQPGWLPGDAWTWTVTGSAEGQRSATAAAQGSGWRTDEGERTHPPGAPLNTTEVRITRTWAAPMRLASEEAVRQHCIGLPLGGSQCGNVTERWAYTPPLDLVRLPLAEGQAWQQAVHVEHTVQDELGVLDQSAPLDETRHFVVLKARTESLAPGELAGWDVAMDNEASDQDGASTLLTYGDAALHLLGWSEFQGGSAVKTFTLASLALQPRASPPAPPPPPPPGTTNGTPSDEPGTTSTGDRGSSGAGAPAATSEPASTPPMPAPSPGSGARGPVGPVPEHDLRGAPGFPAAAALLALLLAARRR